MSRSVIKILGLVFLVFVSGCANIIIPNYIQDQNPYTKTFYAPFEKVHELTIRAIEDAGWAVQEEADPALFERGRELVDSGRQQTLVFTKIRQFSFFLGTRYSRRNVFLRVMADKAVEVEIRHITVTSIMFKTINSYRSDKSVGAIFQKIEEGLQ